MLTRAATRRTLEASRVDEENQIAAMEPGVTSTANSEASSLSPPEVQRRRQITMEEEVGVNYHRRHVVIQEDAYLDNQIQEVSNATQQTWCMLTDDFTINEARNYTDVQMADIDTRLQQKLDEAAQRVISEANQQTAAIARQFQMQLQVTQKTN
ncbi:hypothetical protein PHYPSEUDO_009246 [Phytophthora pseudosyringae]|uniref:Uncharacterized protein n=1 Tax=Phytophthora pseudosyringae TaxID=221518 RepID=A0A8T1VD28_9STRA|nr:hypothetical protein PHYPSEUDO_009246 [Phytophthora pseudosyringae]